MAASVNEFAGCSVPLRFEIEWLRRCALPETLTTIEDPWK
jgi:hypothetical protein